MHRNAAATRSYVERAVRMIYNPDDEMPMEWPATLREQLLLLGSQKQ